ncbi:MAG: hypothetical protein ACJA0I_002147, partial [Gammaproteobacteria bacterium]
YIPAVARVKSLVVNKVDQKTLIISIKPLF